MPRLLSVLFAWKTTKEKMRLLHYHVTPAISSTLSASLDGLRPIILALFVKSQSQWRILKNRRSKKDTQGPPEEEILTSNLEIIFYIEGVLGFWGNNFKLKSKMGSCSSCETVCQSPGEESEEFRLDRLEHKEETGKSAGKGHRAPSTRPQHRSNTSVLAVELQ